ncbi:hypothetical protein FSARC_14951, partial [Fusarium sarcochroum]
MMLALNLYVLALVVAQHSPQVVVRDQLTTEGCYRRQPSTVGLSYLNLQLSHTSCRATCEQDGKTVALMKGPRCYCADTLPPRDSMLPTSSCDYPCPANDQEMCGSYRNGAWTIIGMELRVDVEEDDLGSKPKAIQKPIEPAVRNRVTSQGCFSFLPRRTPEHSYRVEQVRLVRPDFSCSSYCKNVIGMPVAIMRLDQCWCNNKYPALNLLVPDEFCNSPCPGEGDDACGGSEPEAYSVVNTGKQEAVRHDDWRSYVLDWAKATLRPTEKPQPDRLTSQGCFSSLPNIDDDSDDLTEDLNSDLEHQCYQICLENGKSVMIISGWECYCYDVYPAKSARVDDAYCNWPCYANNQTACGGKSRGYPGERDEYFSVYNTGLRMNVENSEDDDEEPPPHQKPITEPVKDSMTSQGCFSGLPPSAELQDLYHFGVHNDEMSCKDICAAKGKAVSTTSGVGCFCADEYPAADSLVADEECNTLCPGWPEICGGNSMGKEGINWRYSVYNTGVNLDVKHADQNDKYTTPFTATEQLPKKPILQRPAQDPVPFTATPQGCFIMLPPSAEKVELPNGELNSQDLCGRICSTMKRNVMLTLGGCCFCADTYPPKSALDGDQACALPCPGDSQMSCGGVATEEGDQYWSFSVWNTGRSMHVEHSSDRLIEYYPTPKQRALQLPEPGEYTSQGCFSELPRYFISFWVYENSPSACYHECKERGATVMFLHMGMCGCSMTYPMRQARILDRGCTFECPGKRLLACGGVGRYSVYNMGINLEVDYDIVRQPTTYRSDTANGRKELTTLASITAQGCYVVITGHTEHQWDVGDLAQRQFYQACISMCRLLAKPLLLMFENECQCAETYPAKPALVDDNGYMIPCVDTIHRTCSAHLPDRYDEHTCI